MLLAFPVRRSPLLAVVAACALLASCAAPPAPPPPPPPPPPVSLSGKLVEQASAYRAYMAHATAVSPGFTNGDQVAAGLRAGAAYQPDQLLRGAIVYGAVAALQDPEFVAGARIYAADPEQRRTIAYEILKDPAYAIGIKGSASAAGLATAALGDDGRKLLDQGRLVIQAAYDVQHSPWSKADVPGRDARLGLAKQLSATPGLGELAETSRLQQASVGAGPLGVTAAATAPPYSPLVVRSLGLAALAALGYATDENVDHILGILTDPATSTCLNMSKLNLYQCLAVARPQYEDVFCLGTHIMQDTGACVMRAAGLDVPPDPRVVAAKAAYEAAKLKKAPVKTGKKAKRAKR